MYAWRGADWIDKLGEKNGKDWKLWLTNWIG